MLALGTATLGESGARPLDPRIRPAWGGATLAGPAFAVVCEPDDNLAIHVAVADAPRGSVLAVEVTGERERGFWGEVLTTAAEARGIAGLVIDGGVRDVRALEAHAFPVFSTVIALRGTAKVAGGAVGESATVGGVDVRTGDWVVGDADGVVAMDEATLADVMAAAGARAEREKELMRRLGEGATTLDLLGLDGTPVRRTTESPE
jgi:4-hydroxy-4-methyl-2-oxoglutarate aldolase